jgi:hypothetical protein
MGKKQKVADEGQEEGQEDEHKARQEKRQQERAALAKAIENADAITIGLAELQDKHRREQEVDEQEQEEGFLVLFLNFILQRKKRPPPIWKTHRREEVEKYLKSAMSGLLGHLVPSESFWYWKFSRKKMKYWGSRDSKGQRDGRGICLWPDPPYGGGGEQRVQAHSCCLSHASTFATRYERTYPSIMILPPASSVPLHTQIRSCMCLQMVGVHSRPKVQGEENHDVIPF